MPWSEWITSSVTTRYATTPRADASSAATVRQEGNADENALVAEAVAAAAGQLTSDDVNRQVNGIAASKGQLDDDPLYTDAQARIAQLFIAPDVGVDPLTQRDWYPEALWDLTEGADFTVRPDRSPTDQDAYVEYEAGPNTLFGWDPWTVAIDISPSLSATPDYATAPTPPIIPLRLALTSDSYPFLTPLYQGLYRTTAWPAWGYGDGIADIGPGIPEGGGTAQVVIDLAAHVSPAAPRFTLIVQPATLGGLAIPTLSVSPTPPSTGYGAGSSLANLLTLRPDPPTMRYQMPRYRYWIPGPEKPLPLRQRQRDDGLGLSTARWRKGSSRQASNRWRGYL